MSNFHIDDFKMVGGHNFGWVGANRPEFVKEQFSLVAHNFVPFIIKGDNPFKSGSQKMMLHDIVRKVLGKDTENYPQQIGDCVSFGNKNAVEYLQCVEILLKGENEKFRNIFPPYVYGTSRALIGKGQIGDNEDGSLGSWAAEAVLKYGILASDEQNVPQYAGQIAKQWGSHQGPPNQFLEIGKTHPVKSAAQIRSWDDLVQSICNGYPCPVSSNQGFSMKPNSQGFHEAEGQWGHCMCCKPQTLISSRLATTIDKIKPGHTVFDMNGNEQKVTEVYTRNYNGIIYKIKSSGNIPIEITGNHPMLVYRDSDEFAEEDSGGGVAILTRKKTKQWINASDVKVGDYLVCPKSNIQPNIQLPKWIKGTHKYKNTPRDLFFDDDVAWMFGLYAADGSSEKGHKIKITLHENEIEKAKRCVEAFLKLGLRSTIKPVKDKKAIRVVVFSAIVANSFLEWFDKKENKHLPEWIWNGWNLKEVLNGVYAGDGGKVHNRENGFRIVNTSTRLIEECRIILCTIGYKPSLSRHIYTNSNNHDRYTLEWYITHKIHTNYWKDNNLMMKVKDIQQEHYCGPVYNLEVENTHSYIANGVVVHNCIIGVDNEYTQPYAIILNSWGPSSMGVLKDFSTGETLPGGTIRAHKNVVESMIAAGETFAYSNFQGFPGQNDKIARELFNLVGKGER